MNELARLEWLVCWEAFWVFPLTMGWSGGMNREPEWLILALPSAVLGLPAGAQN